MDIINVKATSRTAAVAGAIAGVIPREENMPGTGDRSGSCQPGSKSYVFGKRLPG